MSEATIFAPNWPRNALPRDTVLFGYRLVAILGSGSFGITYRAVDAIDQVFAVKECFPSQFAVREHAAVLAKDDKSEEIYRDCLDRFVHEAQALKVFTQSAEASRNVVKVVTLFQANGTAYIVMEFIDGENIEDYLKRHPDGAPEAVIRRTLVSIMQALSYLHASERLHRDIKPANIILRPDLTPVLVDFGAARVHKETSAGFTQIHTAAYGPIEQMEAGRVQGDYSDFYALGMTCYHMIAGQRFGHGLTASNRAYEIAKGRADPLTPAVVIGADRYDARLLRAIDLLLPVDPENRPRSVQDFEARSGGFLAGNDTGTVTAGRPRPPPEALAADPGATVFQASPTGLTGSVARSDRLQAGMPGVPPKPKSSLLPVVFALCGLASFGAVGFVAWQLLKPSKSASSADTPRPTAPGAPTDQADKAYDGGDYIRALQLYTPLARAGNADAAYRLGHMYRAGLGAPADEPQAQQYLTMAAKADDPLAAYELADLDIRGTSVPHDPVAARFWAAFAAKQGNAAAQYLLGTLYELGKGGPPDPVIACQQYLAAAQQGLANAEYKAGRCFAEGIGVSPDLPQARQWMQKAAEHGSQSARQWLEAYPP